MSDEIGKNNIAIKTPGPGPRKTSSGEHRMVLGLQKDIATTREGPLSDLKKINKRLDRLKAKSDPPHEDDQEEPVPDTEPEPKQSP